MSKKYTIAEYARMKGVTERSVRYQIDKGRLLTRREVFNGRETTIVVDDEIEKITEQSKCFMERNTSVNVPKNEILSETSEHVINTALPDDVLSFLQKIYQDNQSLANENRHLAELAGQTKLLVDSESRTRQEYFQLIQEHKQSEMERSELLAKTQLLEKQNQEYLQQVADKAELKAKLELSQQRLKELEEQLSQKQQKKTFKQRFKEWASSL